MEDDEEEEELLQDTNPGPLESEGKDVEDVLNIISQSIYREGEGTKINIQRPIVNFINPIFILIRVRQNKFITIPGQLLLKLCDRSSLLSVVSHSLSAYITTLDPIPLQR